MDFTSSQDKEGLEQKIIDNVKGKINTFEQEGKDKHIPKIKALTEVPVINDNNNFIIGYVVSDFI
jgi:hypothetical protein